MSARHEDDDLTVLVERWQAQHDGDFSLLSFLRANLRIDHAEYARTGRVPVTSEVVERLREDVNAGPDLVLPPPAPLPDAPFAKVVELRRSTRSFSSAAVSLETLSTFLQGALGAVEASSGYGVAGYPRRVIPSAGGLVDVEAHLVAVDIDGLDEGIYRYLPSAHGLAAVDRGSAVWQLSEMCDRASFAIDSAAVLVLVARVDALRWKYGPASYRLGLVDVGIAVESTYLVASSLGLGACAVAGFDDDEVVRRLRLDPEVAVVGAVVALGWPSRASSARLD